MALLKKKKVTALFLWRANLLAKLLDMKKRHWLKIEVKKYSC